MKALGTLNHMDGSDHATADDPLAVCARLPAWPDRTTRLTNEPMGAWRTPNGFLGDGPLKMQWSGRRWDLEDDDYGERIVDGSGHFHGSTGTCERYICAQNCYHDGERIHFPNNAYEVAPRPYRYSETDIRNYLLAQGYTTSQLDTLPWSTELRSEIFNEYAVAIVALVGGFLDCRPFEYPPADDAVDGLCPTSWGELYEMFDYNEQQVLPYTTDTWPGAQVEGFFAWRVVDTSYVPSTFDSARMLRAAWCGSTGSTPGGGNYGTRYSAAATEAERMDDFFDDLPAYTAFDIRIRKTVFLTQTAWRGISNGAGDTFPKEAQAYWSIAAWRISGAAPKALEATHT